MTVPAQRLPSGPKLLVMTLLTVLLVLHGIDCIGSPAIAAETINLHIKPCWDDDGNFWFVRQAEGGEPRIIEVNTADGTMKVGKIDETKTVTTGLSGGPVPKSASGKLGHTEIKFSNETEQPVDIYWITSRGKKQKFRTLQPGKTYVQSTSIGHAWTVNGKNGDFYGSIVPQGLENIAIAKTVFPRAEAKQPNAKLKRRRSALKANQWQVRISSGQLQKRQENQGDDLWDTVKSVNKLVSQGDTLSSLHVSPDERFVAMWKKTAVNKTVVATIESSPDGGGPAVLRQHVYPLPGDEFDRFELVVCDTENWQPISLNLPVFDFGRPTIRFHGEHDVLVEKVDRGHQRFRLFRIDPAGEVVTTPIDEETDTFIWTAHGPPVPLVTYLNSCDYVIHSSEKSGWRQLYLVDLNGKAKPAAITSGEFVVRKIIHVDEENQFLDLLISGYHGDQDPYHRHLARARLNLPKRSQKATKGKSATSPQDLVVVTDGDGDHQFDFSPDRSHVVVSHSRIDAPPTYELRRVADGKLLATLANAKRIAEPGETLSELPTVFSAKGRDGKTDIWGFITFPSDYAADDGKKYPVVEAIYAGPHSAHVPKEYGGSRSYKELNDLGFIVVKVDGMGTAHRSKAFHDVCWRNLKDAGFPDRIAWMKSAAKEFPGMDLERVGIYGTSAGGQNAMGALLFHGDFYKAAMGSCGCHDNRMDKASWNEQWMGYPVGEHYAQSSNVDNAHRLEGDLLLIVGELDTNVPPESTLRVVDALIKADKNFDFLMIPGLGHSGGGDYGWRRTKEFFLQSLMPNSETKVEHQANFGQQEAGKKKSL